MSIIERAIGKLQQSAAASAADAAKTDRNARPPARRVEPSEATGRFATRHRETRAPGESIDVNLEQLRAGGALPPEEHAAVLTDQFRRIKWPILEMTQLPTADGNPANRIMISSSIAGEGKTFTSINMALSIAREKDFSVLLIDADIAKRHASELFKVENRQGLTDAIADPSVDVESLVLGTNLPGLSILPAGRRTHTGPELFASHRMVDIVNQLSREDPQRMLIFDSSPLLLTNEAQVLGKIVDQVILVVRAEYTTQPMVLEAIAMLDKTRPVRCVLNQARTSRTTEYYYGYYPHDRA